jgi:hypothetical protein
MAFDPVRDIVAVISSACNSLYAIDPGASEREIARLFSSGDRPKISEYAALEYAPNGKRFVYYSANDGPHIYSIAPPAGSKWSELTAGVWNWDKLLDDRNNLDPVAHAHAISSCAVNRSHTFGRFRVATYGTIDVAILVRHTDTPVYAMRLN